MVEFGQGYSVVGDPPDGSGFGGEEAIPLAAEELDGFGRWSRALDQLVCRVHVTLPVVADRPSGGNPWSWDPGGERSVTAPICRPSDQEKDRKITASCTDSPSGFQG